MDVGSSVGCEWNRQDRKGKRNVKELPEEKSTIKESCYCWIERVKCYGTSDETNVEMDRYVLKESRKLG
jgi:hypothetical protein